MFLYGVVYGFVSTRVRRLLHCLSLSIYVYDDKSMTDFTFDRKIFLYGRFAFQANLLKWQQLVSNRNSSNVEAAPIIFRKDILTNSLGGNNVYMLTITSAGTQEQISRREVIFLTSRVHPGEANASWMMHGERGVSVGQINEILNKFSSWFDFRNHTIHFERPSTGATSSRRVRI